MNDFDQYIKDEAGKETAELPEKVKARIEQTLSELPEKEKSKTPVRVFPKIIAVAAGFIFVLLFLLPNLSVPYARALEQVPVIGSLVRVITVRNYFYSDGNHEMDIDVPKIEDSENDAADRINRDVSELTALLVNQFYKDLDLSGNSGYGSIKVDYETVTNSDCWFTLKLTVSETAASSNHYFKFYHIDKRTGEIVRLGDLFRTDRYSDVLVTEIKKQMQERMDKDETVVYWLNDSFIGEDFVSVEADRSFYWNEDGEIVIVFDQYEVGPGSTGTPEFTIGKEITEDLLKPEYADISAS